MLELEVILGRRGAGKTTLAARRARAAQQEGALVIVHDPMGDFPPVGKVGTGLGVISGGSSGEAWLLRSPDTMEAVLATSKAKSPKLESGIFLVLDEGVLLGSDPRPSRVRGLLRETIATARHRQLRLLIIAQGANMLDYHTLTLANRLSVFATTDQYGIQKLRGAGVPEKVQKEVMQLPDFQYITGVPGRPEDEWTRHSTEPVNL